MGRVQRIRIAFVGAIYHAYTRGVLKKDIFQDDQDRLKFLDLLEKCVVRYGIRIRAYALMDNHVHLHLKTPLPNISAAMQMLFSAYARYFNDRHDRSGHVFESRFFAPVVEPGHFELRLSRYIHRNPVEARMVSSPENWPWSSYSAFLDPGTCPSWLHPEDALAQLGDDPVETRRQYRRFVDSFGALDPAAAVRTFERSIAIGSEEFRTLHGDTDEEFERHAADIGEIADVSILDVPSMAVTIETVIDVFAYPALPHRPRERPPHPARCGAALVLASLGGWTRSEIGRALGGVTGRTAGRYLARADDLIRRNQDFRRAVIRCLRRLGRPVPDDLLPVAWRSLGHRGKGE